MKIVTGIALLLVLIISLGGCGPKTQMGKESELDLFTLIQ